MTGTNAADGRSADVPRWKDERLDPFRQIADPEVDAMATSLFTIAGPRGLTHLTQQLEDWEAPIPDDAQPELKAFFERPIDYPSWVDPDQIAHAEDLFVSYGPVTMSIILLHGFPRFLTNPAGARAFYMARIFSPDSLRNRMIELAQFTIYMTERGGMGQTWLSPAQAAAKGLPGHGVRKGRGMLALQKLRVIHANVRILLKLAGRDRVTWDRAEFGEPINQEDLAEAVLCFALCTIEGLKKVGIEQTREDQDAMLLAWKTAGLLLGLNEALQPVSLEDAMALREQIFRRHSRKTEEGAILAQEILHVVEALLPPGSRRIPAALMRYQLGDEVADMLEVSNPRWLLAGLTLTRPIWERKHLFARLAMMISPVLMRWVSSRQRLGGARRLVLPDTLATRLGSEH